MKILISPAKSLDFESRLLVKDFSKPYFEKESNTINSILKDIDVNNLSKLMGISQKLAELNWNRNQNFQTNDSKESSRQAIFAFNGDVYNGIDVKSLLETKIPYMQDSLRILSGLYGILKPLDIIKPYRLEMGTKLSVNGSKNLYEFWNEKITAKLNSEIKSNDELIVNLASNEYFDSIDSKNLKGKIVSPQFKDLKNGKLKIISFYAKKARGLMSRHLIENEANNFESILSFEKEGYLYSKIENSKIFLGNKNHWRSIKETLCTFLMSKEMVLKYWEELTSTCKFEHYPFEKPFHKIYDKEYCLSPIPSLAIHCTNINSVFGLSPNIDWKKAWEKSELK